MSRTTRHCLVLVFSLLVASAASLIVLRQVQSIPVREVEVANYQVAVAARNLPVGSLVSAADVKLVAWPASNQVAGAFTKVDEVVNRGLMAPMVANEPFTPVKVAHRERQGGAADNHHAGNAGDCRPGRRRRRRRRLRRARARVDVVVSITQQQQSVARVVVSNIQVLTAGTRIDQQQPQMPAGRRNQPVVTLLVSPDDAERISLAASVGPNHADPSQSDRCGGAVERSGPVWPACSERRTHRRSAPAPPPRPRARAESPGTDCHRPPPPPSVYKVETIRAAKRTEEVVR